VKRAALLLHFSLVVLVACAPRETSTDDGGKAEEVDRAPVVVQATAARRGSIDDVLLAPGETQALSMLRMASPVAGLLTFLSVQAGSRLRAGEVAARVLPLESEAAVHGFAVLRDGGALAPDALARSKRLEEELRARDIRLRSPFAAVVASRSKNPGEQVAAGDVLVDIFDPRSLVVVAQVPAAAAVRLATGAIVEITVGERSVAGRVAAVLPAVLPQSLSIPVRVDLDTVPEPPLLGAPARCRITLAHHPDALLVPFSALLAPPSEGAADVLVVDSGKAGGRRIRVGLQQEPDIEVIDGLREGELVLTSGQYGLVEGTPIQVETPRPDATSETPHPP
jgi:hypothetical protein